MSGLIGGGGSGSGDMAKATYDPNADGVIAVAQGGTGAATLTGVLKGNGTSAFTASAGLVHLRTVVLTAASDNFTTGADASRLIVELWGGGGGGGGVTSTASQAAYGGGGGSGGYALKQFTVDPSTAYAYTCGAAGAAGANTGGDGGAGGDSTFVVGATTVTAKGGGGGKGMAAGTTQTNVIGGAGGAVATNGDVNLGGMPGQLGIRISGILNSSSGAGGGFGGGAAVAGGGAGVDAVGYGAGGSGGACVNGSGAQAGGAGTQGYIIVHEYGT